MKTLSMYQVKRLAVKSKLALQTKELLVWGTALFVLFVGSEVAMLVMLGNL